MIVQLAGCVILNDYGRILLLHRSTPGRTQWELPGGKIEEGETPEQAAMRELDEELGIVVQLVRPLGTGAFEQGDDEYQYMWFLAVVTGADPSLQETETFDDLDYFELEDLESLALSANMQVLFNEILAGSVTLET